MIDYAIKIDLVASEAELGEVRLAILAVHIRVEFRHRIKYYNSCL